ncbi:MAG: glycosyl transferase [Planctomycetota bacterium]|nr:MAG: glycosyl transferase [Planctomycetota bacterium]
MPRVSFLIPVRNAVQTLPAAIESALAQTVSACEVIVVDDGSEDGTREYLRSLEHPRVRVFLRPARGIASALNEGLSYCSGEFVARLDADDLAAPQRLELQLPLFEDPSLAVVDGRMRWASEVPEGMRLHAEWINSVLTHQDFASCRFRECGVVHPAATIRRTVLDSVGGYHEGDFPEDFALWLGIHAAGGRFRKLPEILVTMRDHPGRATRQDPRYRRAAFRKVAERELAAQVLPGREHIVLWGAGVGGRPWLRFLRERGQAPKLLIDVAPRKIGSSRQGIAVRGPEAIREEALDLLLVAVGRRDALALIRAAIQRLRPDLREGRDWFALVCGK